MKLFAKCGRSFLILNLFRKIMSGGHFDYLQHHIGDIAEEVKDVIVKNKVEVPNCDHESWDYDKDGNLYDWAKYYYCFEEKTISRFKEAYRKLKEAEIYAQRIDWLLSGDDGEDTFHERLERDLEELNENFKNETWHYQPSEEK